MLVMVRDKKTPQTELTKRGGMARAAEKAGGGHVLPGAVSWALPSSED